MSRLGHCVQQMAAQSSSVTARDVIESIKALPAEEQEKVLEFVTNELVLRALDKSTFDQATKQVFERHDELMRRVGPRDTD